jgi:hypothetical protein
VHGVGQRVVHFVFGLRPQTEPFHLLHFLAIASCQAVVRPDEIRLHIAELPFGVYWDMVRPLVAVERVEPVAELDVRPVTEEIAPYYYAHHADVIRLDVLARSGGMYADIDTLFVRPVPDGLWSESAVIGRESDVGYDGGPPESSMTNALLMAQAGSPFIARWRERMLDAMDGSWSGHSCRLATRLAGLHPELVRVEPQASFSPLDHTPTGLRQLLQDPSDPRLFAETYSVHLCAHLWWDVARRDFSTVSACDITEDYVRTAGTNLARLARPFLPEHGLF